MVEEVLIMGINNQLYIPKTITVGFQARPGTFTGMLGYVIYTDHKGVLRKENSWQSWRDKNIASLTFENTPQTGFTFNKGIQRDGHWGSGRSVIRVYDQRNFEFEISVDNLIGILMHADVSKRDITEPCIFAWNYNELILLPTNSVEYTESVKHTTKQLTNVNPKELVVGYTYNIKRNNQTKVVYLGHLPTYGSKFTRNNQEQVIATQHVKKGKKHIFIDEAENTIYTSDPKTFIADVVSHEVHPNLPSMMDFYYSNIESQPINGLILRPHIKDCYYVSLNIEGEFVCLYIHLSRTANGKTDLSASIEKYIKYEDGLIKNSIKPQYRSYFSVGSDGYNPTSLHDNHKIITSFVKDMKKAVEDVEFKYDYTGRTNIVTEKLKEVYSNYNAGVLCYILEDGKTSIQSIN